METNKAMPRARMLEWFSPAADLTDLEKLSDHDLQIAYCEALVAALTRKRHNRHSDTH